MVRFLIVATLALAAAVAGGFATPAVAQETDAIIATFEVADEQFRVRIENPQTIEQVRALERGESNATIPIGTLRRGSDVNEPWSWHIDPQEIELAEITIELCDGRPSFVEDDLDYWVDVVGQFCPWNAVLVDVEEVGDATPTLTDEAAVSPTPLPALPDTGGGAGARGTTAQILIAAALATAAALAGGAVLLRSRRA